MSVFAPLLGMFKSRELIVEETPEESEAKAQRDTELRVVCMKSAALRQLQVQPGWQAFSDEVQGRLNALVGQLTTCKEGDLKLMQAKIAELKYVNEIIPRAVAAGEQAEQELRR